MSGEKGNRDFRIDNPRLDIEKAYIREELIFDVKVFLEFCKRDSNMTQIIPDLEGILSYAENSPENSIIRFKINQQTQAVHPYRIIGEINVEKKENVN